MELWSVRQIDQLFYGIRKEGYKCNIVHFFLMKLKKNKYFFCMKKLCQMASKIKKKIKIEVI